MIIVEGPDGAGKTTLMHELVEATGVEIAPKFADSRQGIIDPESLAQRVEAELLEWPRLRIFDRHPLISEPIYGPIIRGTLAPHFDDPDWYVNALGMMRKHRPIIIWCVPPQHVCAFHISEGERDMPGVADNLGQIWSAYYYRMLAFMWAESEDKPNQFHWNIGWEVGADRVFEDICSAIEELQHPSSRVWAR